MNAKDRRPAATGRFATEGGASRKRFHITKLEERIAPKKGGKGTNNCGGTGGTTGGGSASTIY